MITASSNSIATLTRWATSGKQAPILSVIGIVATLTWALISLIGPLVAPYDPLAQSAQTLTAPSFGHLLGTDELGRDLLSRIMWGARVSIPYSALIVAASVVIGTIVGGLAGYFGSWLDEILMRVTDFVFAFPTIVLAMAITAILGPNLRNAVIAVVAVAWPTYARVVRSLVMSAIHSDYVLVARLLGHSSPRAMAVDVLPNVFGPLLVFATLGLGDAMLVLAGLSFLGLGAQPPVAEWGSIISDATAYPDRWWLALFPGLAIVSVVVAVNLVGDYLRDRLDPRVVSR